MLDLTVTVREKNGTFEGVVTLPGLKSTKLTRKDGTTLYPSKAALVTSARALAKRMNMNSNFVQPEKAAAKKSPKQCTKETKQCTKES